VKGCEKLEELGGFELMETTNLAPSQRPALKASLRLCLSA